MNLKASATPGPVPVGTGTRVTSQASWVFTVSGFSSTGTTASSWSAAGWVSPYRDIMMARAAVKDPARGCSPQRWLSTITRAEKPEE